MVPLPDGVKCGDTVTYVMRDRLQKQQLTSTSNPSEGHKQSVIIPKCKDSEQVEFLLSPSGDNGKAENMRIRTKLRTPQENVNYMWPVCVRRVLMK